jgi:hypothetical protein
VAVVPIFFKDHLRMVSITFSGLSRGAPVALLRLPKGLSVTD